MSAFSVSRLYKVAIVSLAAAAMASCSSPHTTPTSEPLVVKLIALNDFHGNINPPVSPTRIPDPAGGSKPLELPTGGIEYMSSLVAQLQAQNPNHSVVAAGDLIGGTPLVSGLFHHEPTIEMLNALGLEFSSVGNHEFDAGSAELLRIQNGGCYPNVTQGTCANGRFGGAKFQYLAANVIDERTNKPLFPGYAIKRFGTGRASLPVAFIGLVLKDTPSIVVSTGVAGLRFEDEADAANALVPQLKAQGIQTIVVLIHEGGQTTQRLFDDASCPNFTGAIKGIVERLDPAVDLIVSGHTHRAYICRHAGRLITSAGSEGRFITDIDMKIDRTTKDVIDLNARQLAVVNDKAPNPLPDRYPTLPKDPRIAALVDFYNRQAAPLAQREVGKITGELTRAIDEAGEATLGRLIADAQLEATRGAGAQIAFMNRGGIRTDLRSNRGVVTYDDVFAVHPFGNALITLTLTGEQIRQLLEQQWTASDTMLQVSSGFEYVWDAKATPGQRVDASSMKIDGRPLEPAQSYRVTVNEFLAQGGNNFTVLKSAPNRERGVVDVEALERYITAHSPISPPSGQRIRRRN